MYIIKTTVDEVASEFNFVSKWINSICKDILDQEVENDKISVFYNYGYFVPKGSGYNLDQLDMMWEERLQYELSKVRVNITIKIDNFIMSNRIEKGKVPESISKIVCEITKLKMKAEYEIHQNKQIFDSVPPIDDSIVNFPTDELKDITNNESEEYYDIDDILDKIQISGFESLTGSEKEFLDKKSKEM
jgi:hypothetical protein